MQPQSPKQDVGDQGAGQAQPNANLSPESSAAADRERIAQLEHELWVRVSEVQFHRQSGQPGELVRCLIEAGNLHFRLKSFDHALTHYAEAEEVAASANLRDGLRVALQNQALVLRVENNFGKAVEVLARLEAACDDARADAALQQCLLDAATLMQAIGKGAGALEKFAKLAELCRERQADPKCLSRLQEALDGQAVVLLTQQRWAELLHVTNEQIAVCQKLESVQGLPRAMYFNGVALRGLGQTELAMVAQQKLERQLRQETALNQVLPACLAEQATLLWHWNLLEPALEKATESVALSRQLCDAANVAERLATVASVHTLLGHTADALTAYEQQQQILQPLRPDLAQRSLGAQGWMHFLRAEVDEAERLFVEQERQAREQNDYLGTAAALDGRGNAAFVRCDFPAAEAIYSELADLCRQHGFREKLLLSGIGGLIRVWLCVDQGEKILDLVSEEQKLRSELVSRLHGEQNEVIRKLVFTDPVALALGNLTWIEKSRGSTYEAFAAAREQEDLCRSAPLPFGLSAALSNQALLHLELGEFENALALAEEREKICRKLSFDWGLQSALREQAQAHHGLGDDRQARRLFDESLAICSRLNLPIELIATLTDQARFYAERQEVETARARAQQARDLAAAHNWTCRVEYLDQLLGSL